MTTTTLLLGLIIIGCVFYVLRTLVEMTGYMVAGMLFFLFILGTFYHLMLQDWSTVTTPLTLKEQIESFLPWASKFPSDTSTEPLGKPIQQAEEKMEVHIHLHIRDGQIEQKAEDSLILNQKPSKKKVPSTPVVPIRQTIEEEEEKIPNVLCQGMNLEGPRFVVVENTYSNEWDVQRRIEQLKANGLQRLSYIWLPCYESESQETGFALLLSRPCRSYRSAKEKFDRCVFDGHSRLLDFKAITILKLNGSAH